jgi:DNA-binding CsgD family transcriptional regulator
MDATWPLAGRDEELRRLADAMDTGEAGVVLAGPPGVGKTRLATESIAMAELRGWPRAVVRANRSAGTIPFGAFAPLLPLGERQAEGLVDALRVASETIAAMAGGSTLLLMVDDAHELDDASSALLGLLALRPEVFVVSTLRTESGPVPESLTGLWKDDVLIRIDLGGLSASATGEIVADVLDGPVEGGTVQTLWATSGGNALFLRELVVGALDAGALHDAGGMWRLRGKLSPSTRLGEVVGLRIGSLDEAARAAMEVVSVAEPVGLSELSTLAAPDAIDLLERRGLVAVHEEGARREVRSAHPLYGEVVRAGVPARRRQEIYRALADQIEARGARRREDMLRVALWRLDGGGGSPEVLLRGAHEARFAFDFVLAERLARAAHAEVPDAESAHLLGETLDALGRHAEAEVVLVAAAQDPDHPADERVRTMIALARSANLFRGLGRADESHAVLAAALADVDDPDLRNELRAQLAVHLLFEGNLREVLAIADPLLASDDLRTFVNGALPGATARALGGRTEEAIAIADRAFEARIELGDQVQMAGPGIYIVARSLALLEAGRLTEADENARLGYDAAAERQLRDGQAWFGVILGRVCLHAGRAAEAARWFREAAVVFDDLEHPGARWGYGGLAHALALVGDLDGADTALADLDAAAPTPVRLMDPEIERARAWVLAQRSEYTLARDSLRRAAAIAAEHGSAALEAAALHDLVRLGDDVSALERLRELSQLVDGRFMSARLEHAEALASHDREGFVRAADAFEDMGALLAAAEAAAGAAREAGREGLSRQANEEAARARNLAMACEGARTPALSLSVAETTPLTKREREVAELAARNLTSRDIAEKLFVSVRTVENHLQRAYEKLGVRSRAELADVLDT